MTIRSTEPHPCSNPACTRQGKGYRKLCQHCTNLKTKFKLTNEQLEKLVATKKTCYLCGKRKTYTQPVADTDVCAACFPSFQLTMDSTWVVMSNALKAKLKAANGQPDGTN